MTNEREDWAWHVAVARLEQRDDAQQRQIDQNTTEIRSLLGLPENLERLRTEMTDRFNKADEAARIRAERQIQRWSAIVATISTLAALGSILLAALRATGH